jgi:hypothetical protein
MTTGLAFAMLAQEVDAQLEVSPLHLAIDRLADVVEERRAHGHVGIEPQLLGHDAREPRPPAGVGQDVLPVTRAELQASHQPQDLGMQIVQAEPKGDGAAFLRTSSSVSSFTF